MTKHLRFLIVLLMTLVWSAGWAQTTIWSEDWTGKAKDTQPQNMKYDNVVYNNTNTSTKIYLESIGGGTSPELLIKQNDTWTVTIKDLKGCFGTFKLEYKSNKSLKVTANSKTVNLSKTDKFTGTFDVAVGTTQLVLTFKASTNARIDDIVLTATSAGESKTATNVSFDSNSNKTFTFTEGKLEGFTAPTATETNNVAGTIKYSSNNESAVKVDASTGALSFPGYGEATITATFTPTDADTYAESKDSYKVVNKADLGDFVFYESFDKCAGKGGNDGTFNGTRSDKVVYENNGWTFTSVNGANKCIKLGSNSNGGSATTPAINLSGKGILTFKIASWEGDGSKVTISVDNGSLSYNGKNATSFAVSPTDKEWNDINMTISATGAVKIKFSSIAKNRFFLDEVMVKEITTPAVETLTLKESDTNTIEAKTGVNVTLNRPMKIGRWNTFCVPFSIDANQVTSQFGEGTQIAEYSVSVDDEIAFATVQSNAIVAGKAYLVKPTKVAATEGYTFSNVNITALVPTKETVDNGAIDFRGIYNQTDITVGLPTNTFAAGIVGNVVKKAVRGSNMKGFRAFFIIPEGVGAQSSYMLKIDGTATSINSINGADVVVNAPVYNLQGQRVDGNNLTPGIYVKAGKKFVVK